MGKPHPMELRTRVVDFVEDGNTHRATAAHFRVSIKFVNDTVKLKRETGSLEPKPHGRQGHGKLASSHDWVRGKIDATGIIRGPMDKEMFDLYVEGILAPTLRPGDVVLRDNLPAHRSNVAARILKEIGAWFLFLPKYSPDLNPIEMAFSKRNALIRKVAARTYDELWRAVGNVCSLFTPNECYNFFAVAGCETN